MIYDISYDHSPVAQLWMDDTPIARQTVKEMVEFWSGWEARLDDVNGDYRRCFLLHLVRSLLAHGRGIVDDEGWSLDGANGVKLLSYWPPDFDETLIEIEESEG